MWKYVTRRCRESFERSANHFEKRSAAGVVNPCNASDEQCKRLRGPPSCEWFYKRKCWGWGQDNNNTNSKRWNFDSLNSSWIGAITWSGALVLGWYTSQLIHLKLKYHCKNFKKDSKLNLQTEEYKKGCSINNILASLQPYTKKKDSLNLTSKIVETFSSNRTPTIYLVSNDKDANDHSIGGSTSRSSDNSDDALGDVLNSIENRLGLAAIENGQHQDGINLLRSAAHRNHAPALYNLGLCYEMGLGVPANEKTAMEMYRSAAALEHPGALYNLGIYYGQGRGGLPRDMITATRLLRLAAVQGQQNAIDALKSLDVAPPEPTPHNDIEPWPNHYPPGCMHENNVPSPSSLFVANAMFNLQATNHRATVY